MYKLSRIVAEYYSSHSQELHKIMLNSFNY